jgi:hypothetical protein
MDDPIELERPYFSDIEKLFSEYVEYYGGKVVEKLNSNKTDRENADYLFENPEIVAELKTFKKDVFSEREDFPRLMELFEKWIANNWMTGEDLREYTFGRRELPQICLEDLIERASKTIERAIHKANKQIEETKKTFQKINSNGLILLINDGNYFFTNEGFLAVISNVISRKFTESSFDVIIYLTINQTTQKEGSNLDYNIWVPIYTKVDIDGKTIVSKELFNFVNDFGKKFGEEFMTLKTGQELKDYKEIKTIKDSFEEFKKHKFIPKEVIYKK